MQNQERVTVIMGAGAVIEGSGIGTTSLTKKIMDECSKHYEDSLKLIIDGLKKLYQIDESSEIFGKVNFEDIFNVAELLYDYKSYMHHTKGYAMQLREFTELKDKYSNLSLSDIYGIQRLIVETINDEIYGYDRKLAEQGEYFKKFFSTLESANVKFDVFNLNYDTWVEQSLSEYDDGYVEYKDGLEKFDLNRYLSTSKNRVAHLHGQILFDYPPIDVNDEQEEYRNFYEPFDTLYKYKNYNDAKKHREMSVHSRDVTQQGNSLYRSNIITGLIKTDKMFWYPMSAYLGRLIRSLEDNKRLIVIGYGFADVYINHLLEMYNACHLNDRKIVLIDFLNTNKTRCVFEHPFNDIHVDTSFTNLMFQDDFWWEKRKYQLGEEKLHISDDNMGMLCVRGFRWCSERVDEVVRFLDIS